MCLLFSVNSFQSTDEEQCSKYLEYINLLCNFVILYFDISEDKVSQMHILLIRIFLNTLNHLRYGKLTERAVKTLVIVLPCNKQLRK